jgi:hypothetical protein
MTPCLRQQSTDALAAPGQCCYLPLSINHVLQSAPDIAVFQGREAEASAPRLQGRYDFVDVVADQAEARVSGILLNHCTCIQKTAVNFLKMMDCF